MRILFGTWYDWCDPNDPEENSKCTTANNNGNHVGTKLAEFNAVEYVGCLMSGICLVDQMHSRSI